MANKIKIDEDTYECPSCPDCGELIEDGDDY